MALGADVGAHLLAGSLAEVNAALFHGVAESGAGDDQIHRYRVMAIGTGGAEMQLILEVVIGRAVKIFPSHFGNQAGGFGGVAVDAGAGLVDDLYALGVFLVYLGVEMAALFVVVFAEGITGHKRIIAG